MKINSSLDSLILHIFLDIDKVSVLFELRDVLMANRCIKGIDCLFDFGVSW